ANNAMRRPRALWTEQVGGELIRRYFAEDEHEEAAWVTREMMRLHESENERWGDMAVFYRTNAMSRVIEEQLVRLKIPYRVVGGPCPASPSWPGCSTSCGRRLAPPRPCSKRSWPGPGTQLNYRRTGRWRPRAGWRTWPSWSAGPGTSRKQRPPRAGTPAWPPSWRRSAWWRTRTRSPTTPPTWSS